MVGGVLRVVKSPVRPARPISAQERGGGSSRIVVGAETTLKVAVFNPVARYSPALNDVMGPPHGLVAGGGWRVAG